MKYMLCTSLVIIISLSFASCGNDKKESSETQTKTTDDDRIRITQAQFDQNGMAFSTLQEKEFPIVVKATGIIDVPPENRSVVNATMGGYIKTLPLLIGDFVKKGQALMIIENPEFVTLQQEYMEVHESLGFLKSEYERQKTLYEENISSQKSYLKTESEYKTALARYSGLRKQLAMLNISPAKVVEGNITSSTTIFAPISGSVTKVNVSKGQLCCPGDAYS